MGKSIFIKVIVLFLFVIGNLNSQSLNGSFESKFKRYQKNENFTGEQTQNWNTVAWKGERIHKQIVLWSNSNINNISYSISNLVNRNDEIQSSEVSMRFGKYIKGDPEARSCSEYPTHTSFVEIADGLSNNEVTSLNSTDPIKIWLSIDVPEITTAGNYIGTLTVNAGANQLVFTINLNVVDYILPAASDWSFHLDIWQFPVNILNHYNTENPNNKIEIWSDEHFALFETAYKFLADTGQKSITTYIKGGSLGAESMVKWIKKNDGSWEYDFTAFDKYVSTLMTWGITKQISCFSPVGWNESEIPFWDEATGSLMNLNAPLGSTTYNTRWDHFLTTFKTHLDDKGWFEKTVLYLDEVSEEKLNSVATMVHGNDSNWKLGIAYSHGLSNSSKANFYDLSGILEDASNEGISGDKISTFYTSCTQKIPNNYVTPENNPAEMTWMGWHATKERYDGYLRWAYDYWSLNDPFDARDGAHTAGDFSMIYRASNIAPPEILSSIRFELLRDGIQDFEKLKILKAPLEGSSDPYDKEILNKLNAIIDDFNKSSGAIAEKLIIEGQQAIEDIVLGTFSYCKVVGGADTNYYVKSLTTTGGSENISFSTNQFPNTGYEHHTTSKIIVSLGENIILNLENSEASNCARTKVWIDWNNDDDFDDPKEEIFNGGNSGACTNNRSYSIPITVPANLDQGIRRIRIQVREANESEPQSCGAVEKSGTTDFDLEVLIVDPYCEAQGGGFLDYYVVGLTTTGGASTNINFTGKGFPLNGYEHHSATKIDVNTGESFVLNLENSSTSNCARTGIWIDWNGDEDFDDTGEHVYNEDVFQSCENTTSETINIQVPNNATIGKTRMRIRLRDSWLDEPEPCGTYNHTGTADFDVEIKKKPLNLPDENFTIATTGETCPNKNNGIINIEAKADHPYVATIDGVKHNFTNSLKLENLSPDIYNLCITIDGEDYEQCYSLKINEGESVQGKTTIKSNIIELTINKGTAPYHVMVNGVSRFTTKSSIFNVEVRQGDMVEVKTSIPCEGIFFKRIDLFQNAIVYPNPSTGIFTLEMPKGIKEVEAKLYNAQLQLIVAKRVIAKNGEIKLDITNQSNGVYFAKIYLKEPLYIKLVKKN